MRLDGFRATVLFLIFAALLPLGLLRSPVIDNAIGIAIVLCAGYWLVLRGSAIGRYERMIAGAVMFAGIATNFVGERSYAAWIGLGICGGAIYWGLLRESAMGRYERMIIVAVIITGFAMAFVA